MPDPTPFHVLAHALVDRVVEHASARGWRMVAVVLDPQFSLSAARRMDGAFPSSVPVAQAKAHTALNFGTSIDALKERIKPENRIALAGVEERLIFLRGGSPIVVDGRTLGALGVSGGTEDQDAECVEIALGVAVAA